MYTRGCVCSSRRPLQRVAWAGSEVVVTVSSSACKCGVEAVVFVRVSLAQQQLKHMYMALATAKQFASFVLLCVILELIVGIWSRFIFYVPIDVVICPV